MPKTANIIQIIILLFKSYYGEEFVNLVSILNLIYEYKMRQNPITTNHL